MKKTLMTVALGSMLFSSCGLYQRYESKSSVPDNVYGVASVDSTCNIAETEWQRMFTDAKLQNLISNALANNTEAKTALLRTEQAEVGYRTSRLAYLPTVAFSPNVQVQKMGDMGSSTTYSLPVQVDWVVDVFGARTTNSRRKAKASLDYAQDYDQAVKCRLVSTVATLYFDLLALDMQKEIQQEMIALYEKTYQGVQTLYETGQYMSTAVNQTRAQLEQLKVNLIELDNAIESAEHAICEVMDEPYHHIERGVMDGIVMPSKVGTGVPADLLRLRPDVRVAERKIEMAYYDVLIDKGAMYPAISFTANGGWQRLAVDGMDDPKVWFIQGIGSLVQPIFMGGRLRANLKVSKLEQQIAVEEFRQTVIKAGHEVTNALSKCQKAKDKEPHINAQIAALSDAVMANQELMNHGSATYLEVLISLQDLLQAKNAEVLNKVSGMQALVELYAALGGK